MLLKGEEDSGDATRRCLEAQLEEMQQVLEANNLIKPSTRDGARPSEVRFARRTDAPRGGSKGKQVDSYIEIESLSDSKIVATGRQKIPLSRTHSGVDFPQALNAKQNREDGDLRAKLLARTTLAAKIIVPERSTTRTAKRTNPEISNPFRTRD